MREAKKLTIFPYTHHYRTYKHYIKLNKTGRKFIGKKSTLCLYNAVYINDTNIVKQAYGKVQGKGFDSLKK
jgi:hypothetical protein